MSDRHDFDEFINRTIKLHLARRAARETMRKLRRLVADVEQESRVQQQCARVLMVVIVCVIVSILITMVIWNQAG